MHRRRGPPRPSSFLLPKFPISLHSISILYSATLTPSAFFCLFIFFLNLNPIYKSQIQTQSYNCRRRLPCSTDTATTNVVLFLLAVGWWLMREREQRARYGSLLLVRPSKPSIRACMEQSLEQFVCVSSVLSSLVPPYSVVCPPPPTPRSRINTLGI